MSLWSGEGYESLAPLFPRQPRMEGGAAQPVQAAALGLPRGALGAPGRTGEGGPRPDPGADPQPHLARDRGGGALQEDPKRRPGRRRRGPHLRGLAQARPRRGPAAAFTETVPSAGVGHRRREPAPVRRAPARQGACRRGAARVDVPEGAGGKGARERRRARAPCGPVGGGLRRRRRQRRRQVLADEEFRRGRHLAAGGEEDPRPAPRPRGRGPRRRGGRRRGRPSRRRPAGRPGWARTASCRSSRRSSRNRRLYVGHDTGAMHMAGARRPPVVGIFGGGHWPRFRPSARQAVSGRPAPALLRVQLGLPFWRRALREDHPRLRRHRGGRADPGRRATARSTRSWSRARFPDAALGLIAAADPGDLRSQARPGASASTRSRNSRPRRTPRTWRSGSSSAPPRSARPRWRPSRRSSSRSAPTRTRRSPSLRSRPIPRTWRSGTSSAPPRSARPRWRPSRPSSSRSAPTRTRRSPS